jgi:hypothetical protein
MTTLGDVIAALRASLERLPFTELANALDAAEEARGLIGAQDCWQSCLNGWAARRQASGLIRTASNTAS